MKALFKNFIDIIYPLRCHSCQKYLMENRMRNDREKIPICQDCLNAFSRIEPPYCRVCSRPFESLVNGNHLCEDCLRRRPYYDAIGSPYIYEGELMTMIHQLKYGGKIHLADSLGRILARFATEWLAPSEGLLMMPVPLHPKRLRERGFNQSLLFARSINLPLDADLDYLSLRRTRYTRPQTGLKSDERRRNVRRAFELSGRRDINRQTVILVDDVATTGNTLNECARVLKKSGCDRVFCLVLARTAGN
jgi:ComF family protein